MQRVAATAVLCKWPQQKSKEGPCLFWGKAVLTDLVKDWVCKNTLAASKNQCFLLQHTCLLSCVQSHLLDMLRRTHTLQGYGDNSAVTQTMSFYLLHVLRGVNTS